MLKNRKLKKVTPKVKLTAIDPNTRLSSHNRFQRVFRVLGKTAGLGLLAGTVGLGVREGINSRKANTAREVSIHSLVKSDSGVRAAKIYTRNLNRKHPKYVENIKSRVSVLGILEKKLSESKKSSDLSVSRAMHTLEKSTLQGADFRFSSGQINYTKNEKLREFYKEFNSLSLGTRKELFDLSRTKGTIGGIQKEAIRDGFNRRGN
ncbi:MAG: hypothetical protein PHX27_02610 [Candidatus ainarchaeum sp.]|nr:hypothetical protein [Candidatus ainarchaeum sp.]